MLPSCYIQAMSPPCPHLRSVCRTMAHIHTFVVRTAVKAGMYTLPSREAFLQTLGADGEGSGNAPDSSFPLELRSKDRMQLCAS